MYLSLRDRYLSAVEECIDLLDRGYIMVPPARTFSLESRPKTPSTASTPSLRSKTPVNVSMAPTGGMNGGNVKVVVRVRAFLPRGEYSVNFMSNNDH